MFGDKENIPATWTFNDNKQKKKFEQWGFKIERGVRGRRYSVYMTEGEYVHYREMYREEALNKQKRMR